MLYKTKQRNIIGKIVLWVLILIIIGGFLAALWFVWQIKFVRGISLKDVQIEPGQGVNEISDSLFNAGAIQSQLAFETYLYVRGWEGALIAGTYDIPRSSVIELTEILRQGPNPNEIRVTLIEGWTLKDIAEKLAKEEIVDEDEFMNIVSRPVANGIHKEKYALLASKPDSVDLEGYLFPDTYRIFKGTSVLEVVELLVNTMSQRFSDQMLKDIDIQRDTIHEILTMASIIEKEVRSDYDRRIVSGILWKRIDVDMPLQVDSTINYITGNNRPSVTITETEIDDAFNTYQNKGLPPGPISNPSLSAIMAAIYPLETEYWYYLSTPEGETIFSRTFEDHVEAKNKYLK